MVTSVYFFDKNQLWFLDLEVLFNKTQKYKIFSLRRLQSIRFPRSNFRLFLIIFDNLFIDIKLMITTLLSGYNRFFLTFDFAVTHILISKFFIITFLKLLTTKYKIENTFLWRTHKFYVALKQLSKKHCHRFLL